MAECRRPRKTDGRPCENPVSREGLACHLHGGHKLPASGTRKPARTTTSYSAPRMPAMPPPSHDRTPRPKPQPARRVTPPPPTRRELDRERVREAAEFCADTLSGGWQEAVADRAAEYAAVTWQRLLRSRRKRSCKTLARMARMILKAKTQIHTSVGKLAGRVAGALAANDAARAFTEELVSNIPLPVDAKMIAVARGIQVTGILLCVMDGRDLTDCECFIDLALTETKERVKQILVGAMPDWVNLARFRPQQAAA